MKWKLFSILIVLSVLLVACGTNNQESMRNTGEGPANVKNRQSDDMNNNRNNTENVRDKRQDTNKRENDNRQDKGKENDRDNNDRYDVSEEAADKITDEVSEIDHAYVLTTGNNAYVAAQFDADDRDGNRNDDNKKGETNRDNRTDRDKTDRDRNDRDNATRDNKQNVGNNDQMDEDDRLTDDVKKEVSDIVKSIDGDIDDVYVSTNPDFIDLTGNYVNDMNNGHPVRGFFDKMGDMVERLFPQNR